MEKVFLYNHVPFEVFFEAKDTNAQTKRQVDYCDSDTIRGTKNLLNDKFLPSLFKLLFIALASIYLFLIIIFCLQFH